MWCRWSSGEREDDTVTDPNVDTNDDAADALHWVDELVERLNLSEDAAATLIRGAVGVLKGQGPGDVIRDIGFDLFTTAQAVAQAVWVARSHPGFYTASFDPFGFRAAADASRRSSPWTADEVTQRLSLYGNHERHEPFLTWWEQDLLPTPLLREVLMGVWTMVPTGQIDTRTWVAMFRMIGFVTEPPGLDRPNRPLTLWRGSTRNGWNRLAWTSDRAMAAWFAWRVPRTTSARYGCLFEATVEPSQVLARAEERGESEVIVDPAGLEFGRNVTLIRRFSEEDDNPRIDH